MTTRTSQSSDSVMPVASLREYFRDSLDSAMRDNRLNVDNQTACYVVNLLTLFARSEALYEDTEEGPRLKPLALMLNDALEAATPEERNFALQRLGDVALFVAGFFADGLQRAVVDLDYYICMGGGAYDTLAMRVRGTIRGQAFGPVFTELASKFQPFVDVLNDVRDETRNATDADILRLYEVWLKTGSQRAARQLDRLGVPPAPAAATNYEH